MTSLRPNLVKRIERLPKPTNVAGAMQPLFEAISNSIHSTQARFLDGVAEQGRVVVTVSTDRKKDNVWATVEDNGVGLNDKNWEAFTTTDTDNKIEIGGKGVSPWFEAVQARPEPCAPIKRRLFARPFLTHAVVRCARLPSGSDCSRLSTGFGGWPIA